MNKEIFGAFLAQTRKEAGMTQKERADKLHVTDNDGVVELFVRTQYKEEPYLLYDAEDGRVTSRYVDNVPDEVQELLRTA